MYKTLRKTLLLAATFVLTTAGAASAATIVNLDGRTNTSVGGANGVLLNLAAGVYEVTFVEDQYTAFTRWNSVSGCDSVGEHCRTGWENSARIVAGGVEYLFGDANASGGYGPKAGELAYFATPDASLAHAVANYSLRFTLSEAGSVRFYIHDTPVTDNHGGVSLSVAAVPEASTWAMLVAGFGLVGVGMRRRRLAGVCVHA